MATICVDVPDNEKDRVLQSYTEFHEYALYAKPGETRPQFAKRMLAKHLKQCVKEQEAQVAATAAGQAAADDVEQIPIT